MSSLSKTVILIPHFNNLNGLAKSLSCIRHDTSIDVLIIDDGSNTDSKPNILLLKGLLHVNVNLDIIFLKQNKGIAEALNHGLNYILEHNNYEYIARIDCGDTCVKNRFTLQEDYLHKNKDVSLVGSWVKWVNGYNEKELFTYRPPAEYKKIKKQMSFRCNVIHPSVMYRVSIVKEIGGYPVHFKAAEDYAYFFEIAKQSKVANIPKILTTTEHNKKGITQQNKRTQGISKLKVAMAYGKKDFYLLYGIFRNLILIYTPANFILRVKSQLKWL